MAAGLPVIASDAEAVQEPTDDGAMIMPVRPDGKLSVMHNRWSCTTPKVPRSDAPRSTCSVVIVNVG
jgi:hypothetical protein